MITADNDLIEQIVANVLAELQPPHTVRAPVMAPLPSPPVSSQPVAVELDMPVITADLLAERCRPGHALRIGRRSILTPSARDWLAGKKIAWSRSGGAAGETSTSTARWHMVLTTVTPALATLRPSLMHWRMELLGTPREAAEFASRVLSTSEADGVLALCGAAEAVACLANRNQKIRAAVLNSARELSVLVDQLGPNLLVINPRGKSYVELRNLVLAVGLLNTPQPPAGL